MERRLAAILAADVVGYSRLMEQDEAGTFERLRQRRRQLVEPAVERRRGRIFKLMGDGLLAEFGSTVDALECAAAIQQSMDEINAALPPEERILMRIGVHVGEVIVEDEDRHGDAVNIAARLQQLADPGGVTVSRQVAEHARDKSAFAFEPCGERQLKNIAGPIAVYRLRPRDDASRPWAPGAASRSDRPSIAVLPFDNMSGDREQDYFADGIVEEIITALSRMRSLFVIARNSSFTYKGRSVDVKQVGRELGVRYVLEGSVRKAGAKVRITGQLIDAETGAHLWADRFDGALEDIFDLQDQVTARVVSAIAPRLEQAEIERAKRKPTENLDAYDYYLRGMAAVHLWTREGNEEALSLFSRAIELDPGFAAAYGMAARCYSQRLGSGWMVDRAEETAEAERLARRAAALGRDDAVALCTSGLALALVAGDIDTGAELIERALALNPNLASAWAFSAWVKVWGGDPEGALERAGRAMQMSPHDPHISNMQAAAGMANLFAGRHAEAWSWADMAVRSNPNHLIAACVAAASGAHAGRIAEAKAMADRLRMLHPELRASNLSFLFLKRPEHLNRLAEGLRMAGIPD
jgi:TolB-like protein/class 3 adenylate cyclase